MGLADKAMDKVKLMAAALRAQFQVEGLIPTRWRWCPKQPSPKQQVLLAGDYHEAFYGGAAGGGKTALLLMAALKYVDHPQYRALILRRTYSALEQPRGVIEQSKEWLQGTGAEYAQKRYEWNFPSGAQIKFGQIRHNGDLEKYQGGGYHFCGFDEVTQFSEYQYTYLFSRMRKDMDSLDIPLRIYSGSNPSHTAKWVYNYFIKKAIKEGDFTYFAQHVNDVGDTWSSVYVPARLEDNPGIDQESYRKSLAHLDPVLRAQLLSGDWNIMPQGDIYPYKEPHQVITMSEFANMYQDDHIPKDWFISMALDWGASKTSTTAGTWIATSAKRTMLPDRKFIFREKDWLKPTEPKVAREIIDIESVRGEAKRIQHRVISHDAATERRSFNEYYGLKFQSAIHSVLSGISVVRYHMDLHYLDLPHPFRPALNGQPFIYLLVPDDQGTCYRREVMNEDDLSPWIVDQAIDHDGLIDHRSAFASYAWDESGKAPVKGFGWDNIMDAVRMCAWKSFAMPRTYTKTEREDERLRPELRTETLWNAYEKVRKEDLDKAVHLLNNDMLNRQMELAIMGIIKNKSSKPSGTKPWQLPFGQR